METPKLLIDGKLVAGDQTMQVINPATEEVLAGLPARFRGAAQPGGRRGEGRVSEVGRKPTSASARQDHRRQIADAIDSQCRTSLARMLTQEQGKPLPDADRRSDGMAAFFRYFATLDLPMKVLEDSGERKVELTASRLASSAPSFRGTSRCSCWRSRCRRRSWPAIRWSSSPRRRRR